MSNKSKADAWQKRLRTSKKTKKEAQHDLWYYDDKEDEITFIWDDEEEIDNLYRLLREKNIELNGLERLPDATAELHELLLAVEEDRGVAEGVNDFDCYGFLDSGCDDGYYYTDEMEPLEDPVLEFDDMSWYDMTSSKLNHKNDGDHFEHMWPAVNVMCESLMYEPDQWIFEERTFRKKGTKLEYWSGFSGYPVTEVWSNGKDHSIRDKKVFSVEQGRKIAEAIEIAKRGSSRPEQQLVLQALGMTGRSVIDLRGVVHIPKAMNFWQRLLFLFTARCKIN